MKQFLNHIDKFLYPFFASLATGIASHFYPKDYLKIALAAGLGSFTCSLLLMQLKKLYKRKSEQVFITISSIIIIIVFTIASFITLQNLPKPNFLISTSLSLVVGLTTIHILDFILRWSKRSKITLIVTLLLTLVLFFSTNLASNRY